MKATVTVYPRREILDPQGKAIREALGRIGFTGVEDVRAGKSFEIELAGEDREAAGRVLEEMCRKLLANPVVEDYSIDLGGRAGAGGAP
ncbi:MAG TPA: phosphoribosylformylglycinamidine synthase subunit PurS [Thermoanaerobaculia bacterium]|nr:phosphoribosylformylglycinamidine synthase subunit PurS [Thermoanaerobaculia bacterium]